MTEVKNLLFQPLTLHLADGESLHLGPRQRRVIAPSQASPELEKAARRGLVTLTERADADNVDNVDNMDKVDDVNVHADAADSAGATDPASATEPAATPSSANEGEPQA